MPQALPMKCPTCPFTTMTRDIDMYVHLVDAHDIPHPTAHVLFIQAIRDTYPMSRWTERLSTPTLTPPTEPKSRYDAKQPFLSLNPDPKEKGS